MVIACDAAITILVAVVTVLAGLTGAAPSVDPEFGLVTVAAVLCSLPARRAWALSELGQGADEYRRLGLGLLTAAIVLALAAPLLGPLDLRPWLFVALPVIAALTLVVRYAIRQHLHRERGKGHGMLPVVVAGSRDSLADLIDRTRGNTDVGWRVEAACVVTPDAMAERLAEIDGVPVVGDLAELAEKVRSGGYRVVAVTPDPYWTPQRLQRLAWDLEGTSAELVVAPVLVDVGVPRLRMSGVLGMPMLRVAQPAFAGGQRLVKEVVDRVGAAVLLTLAAPLLLSIAAAVKLTDFGPVFYGQQRVKRDGETFHIWKFRTMREGAHAEVAELAQHNDVDGPMFAIRDDPRVTKVGKLLRRFSLDELPQLFNVLTGSMSLVGPRPPLPTETQTYGPDVGRRLLVKPGMTGLWQVSGRNDLSWEESVRLDLRYVEDWSLALDAVILWKTVRAVLGGKGAF